MLDVPDYRQQPVVRFIYAWPAFIGVILFVSLTFYGTAHCLLRSFDTSSTQRIGSSSNSVRKDVFYVVAAPLIFQGLCVSIYTTWMSWKFFRHNWGEKKKTVPLLFFISFQDALYRKTQAKETKKKTTLSSFFSRSCFINSWSNVSYLIGLGRKEEEKKENTCQSCTKPIRFVSLFFFFLLYMSPGVVVIFNRTLFFFQIGRAHVWTPVTG